MGDSKEIWLIFFIFLFFNENKQKNMKVLNSTWFFSSRKQLSHKDFKISCNLSTGFLFFSNSTPKICSSPEISFFKVNIEILRWSIFSFKVAEHRSHQSLSLQVSLLWSITTSPSSSIISSFALFTNILRTCVQDFSFNSSSSIASFSKEKKRTKSRVNKDSKE